MPSYRMFPRVAVGTSEKLTYISLSTLELFFIETSTEVQSLLIKILSFISNEDSAFFRFFVLVVVDKDCG